jgi:uncharacterized protein (TIGR02145 family)
MKRKIWICTLMITFILLIVSACKKKDNDDNDDNTTPPVTTVTDIDGNVYHTVIIGSQTWTVEDLKVIHYRNGDVIPNVTDPTDWNNLITGAYCNYNNDVNNVSTYGRLYNWFAVKDARNICPLGWHVPADSEWTVLATYLGGETVAGGKLKEAGTTHWTSPNIGATNETGFKALPDGYRAYNGTFYGITEDCIWWTTTQDDVFNGWMRQVSFIESDLVRDYQAKTVGLSVRCVKD